MPQPYFDTEACQVAFGDRLKHVVDIFAWCLRSANKGTFSLSSAGRIHLGGRNFDEGLDRLLIDVIEGVPALRHLLIRELDAVARLKGITVVDVRIHAISGFDIYYKTL